MNIAKHFKLNVAAINAILIGQPQETGFVSADGDPYLRFDLLDSVTCRCSVDPSIHSFETQEVYVRLRDVNSDDWKMIDENDADKGFYRLNGEKHWVVDFSKGQELPIYQSETIREWARKDRRGRGAIEGARINESLIAKIAEAKAAALAKAEEPKVSKPKPDSVKNKS